MSDSDGHTGTIYNIIAHGESNTFPLLLTSLKKSDGHIEYIIHTTFKSGYSFGFQPSVFFAEMGFDRYEGQCPIIHDNVCFYRVVAVTHNFYGRPEYFVGDRNVKEAFLAFSRKLDRLFELRVEEETILQTIGIKSSGKFVFGQPTEIKIEEGDIPLWVDEVKFPRLRNLEAQKAGIQQEIDQLTQFLPLLYATGTPLEEAVVRALKLFSLEAERTEKAATVDVLAQTSDGSQKFGIEVTGVDGSVRRDSEKKLVQVISFEVQKEHGEKTILVANTYKSTPISERKDKTHFTQQALDVLKAHSILILTGWDLYCMVRDVLDSSRTKQELVEMLYTTSGRLSYGS
jgi:hypothetical protein